MKITLKDKYTLIFGKPTILTQHKEIKCLRESHKVPTRHKIYNCMTGIMCKVESLLKHQV